MKFKKRVKGIFRSIAFFILVPLALFCLPSFSLSQQVKDFTNLGLYGGQISNIAIDPSNPDKMFAASAQGDGLFNSIDGGSSWQAVETDGKLPGEDEFTNHSVEKVKIAPTNSQNIWVAHNFWAEKSIDGGATWTHIRNSTMQQDCQGCGGPGDNFRFTLSLAIDPLDSQTVYVGAAGPSSTFSKGAIYKTTDGGTTWKKMNQGNNLDFAVVDIDIDPQNKHIIWAVTNSFGFGGFGGTLYRSIDDGETWSAIFSLTPFGGAFLTVAVKPNDSNIVFTGSGFGIIKHFFDTTLNQWKFLFPVVPGSGFVQDISFDPQDPNTLYATWLNGFGDGIGKVGRSTDGGINWEIYPHIYDFKTLTIHPTNREIIFAGEFNEGLFKSQDHGQTWTPVNNGINAVTVHDVAIDPRDKTHILAATFAGLFEKRGEGTWSQLLKSTTRSILFHPTDSQIFFAGLEGFFAKTIDGGLHWTFSNKLIDGRNSVSDIALDPTNTDTIFIAIAGFTNYGEIDKSTDGGNTFIKVLDGVNQSFEKYPFNVVAIDPSNNQHIFAGGGSFFAPKVLGDLWESRDGGGNWTRTGLQNEIVNALLIDPQDPTIMYAGTGWSGGADIPLYKSTNGGVTWIASFEGITGPPFPFNAVTDLEFHRKNKDVIYASTLSQGIYVSPNQARNWLNLGTPKYDVYAIAASSLYGATQGGLLQLTGTGLIYGKVTDAFSQSNMNGAMVFTDIGVITISINGEYMMVSPSGIFDITSIADGFANKTLKSITVLGGDVARQDISMKSGITDPSLVPGQDVTMTSEGNKYCFIATAAYGSPLAKQVKILRKFRDDYLLPYPIGQRLVAFYYKNGKPAAEYIDLHPWLKPPVRVILYPVVGLAWLMLSKNAIAMVFIGLCILLVFVGTVRRFKSKKTLGGTINEK